LYSRNKILHLIYIAVLLSGTAIFFSCREKIEIINASIRYDQPTQTVIDFKTSYSDSALLQLTLEAPIMEYYGKMEEPYSEFREGLLVSFFDGAGEPSAWLSSRYAKYLEKQKLWEVRDSVVAVNEKGELLETELLYWDEEKELIYTDKFVRITQQDQIITGTGLESDPRFSRWRIKNVEATLYFDDE